MFIKINNFRDKQKHNSVHWFCALHYPTAAHSVNDCKWGFFCFYASSYGKKAFLVHPILPIPGFSLHNGFFQGQEEARNQQRTRTGKSVKLGDLSYPYINSVLSNSMEDIGNVIIIVSGERFEAHESMLSATSHVLKNMLSNGMRESETKTITFDNISHSQYSGKVDTDVLDDVCSIEIVQLAHQYDIKVLMILAEKK